MKPNWFTIVASADGPAEIQIYEQIGKSFWDNSGVDAKSFADQLKAIPRAQPINLRINSPGGNVWDGLAIYNLLKERSQQVTCYIDGIAASIASVIALAASTVIIPKNGLFMIHDPRGFCEGTAVEMQEMAAVLDKHKDALVSVYVSETGQTEEDIRAKMEAETWFTGEEALAFGLATQLTEEVQVAASFDLSRFRNAPTAKQPATGKPTEHMKIKNIHLNHDASGTAGGSGGAAPAGKPVTAESETKIINLQEQLNAVTSQLARERKGTIERSIDNLVLEGRVQAGDRDFWVSAALKDEAVIDKLKQNAVIQPETAPVPALAEVSKASIKDIEREMQRLRAPQASFVHGNNVEPKDRIASATSAALFHQKNRGQMMEILNANTIGSGLKRQVLLQEIIRPFARRIMPLKAFCSVFSGIPLQGLNTVEVPYLPLVSTASTDFVTANGYVMGDSTQNTKTVTINKRKYQPMRFTSEELSRQPALNLLKIAEAKAEKLAADVFSDVLSVVTLANFGASASVGLASAFDLLDVVDLKGVADVAEWPDVGRSLILTSAYDVNLNKQTGISSALNFGSNDAISKGSIRQIEGFDYYMCNHIPANGESLTGMIAFMSAIIFAGSPIGPTEEVRGQLSQYEIVIDPQTGASFEYRVWGNPDFDERREIIEANYGYAAGETSALKRITSA